MGLEHHLERSFYHIGMLVGYRPYLTTLISVLITCGLGYGFFIIDSESRPEKQWVPSGAVALDQKDYVDAQWPGSQRFAFWIATCKVDNTKFPPGSEEGNKHHVT